jgi:hypothetical protein
MVYRYVTYALFTLRLFGNLTKFINPFWSE